MLLVDDMPLDERIRKGNVIYRTRTRDVEDTLAQLLHDEDQSIAAAAILLVEERGLWSLADDLEHVLAHRDVRDSARLRGGVVGAGRATACQAERRSALWQEPLPAVELADRLRRCRCSTSRTVDELFRLAALGRQVRYETGRALYERGDAAGVAAVPARRPRRGRTAPTDDRRWRRRRALAFEEVLEGSPMRGDDHRARARRSRCR